MAKIFASIILKNRISDIMDQQLRSQQAGFKIGRSCIDHITTVRSIIEELREMGQKLYLTFVDFKRAFDNISHAQLWSILRKNRLPNKIIKMIQILYKNTSCRISHKGYVSEEISLGKGVIEG